MNFDKKSIEEYTEAEFLDFVSEFFHNTSSHRGKALEHYRDKLLSHFVMITEHPDESDVLFYPKEGQEDSPNGVLKEVKEWRAENGKPGFKKP